LTASSTVSFWLWLASFRCQESLARRAKNFSKKAKNGQQWQQADQAFSGVYSGAMSF
jgi:hypothetical protein